MSKKNEIYYFRRKFFLSRKRETYFDAAVDVVGMLWRWPIDIYHHNSQYKRFRMDLDETHSEISNEREMMHGCFLDASDCENGISKVREVLKVSKGHKVP